MPIVRKLLASDGATYVERISAAPHRGDWGAVHEASEWRCVLPGQGQVHWRSGEEQVFVDALTAFRLSPGDAYQLRHDVARDHHVLCGRATRVTGSGQRAWLLRPRELFAVRRALARLRRGDEEDVTTVGAIARKALDAAFMLRSDRTSPAVLRARQRVAAASNEQLSVEELAEEARCSPFHLARLFRESVGTSPHQYRLHLRIATALQRLEDAGAGLADLAFDLGFSSQSHFGEAFRQAVGCSPGQARLALR